MPRGRATRSRIGQNRRVGRRILAVVGLLFAATVGGGACGASGPCDGPAPGGSGTFVGRLTAVRGEHATFAVETYAPNPGGPVLTTPPRAAASVDVRYDSDEIKFLRTGRRYSVVVFPTENGPGSGVHHADDNCSGGTVYANGSRIDTSLWSRTIVRRVLLGFVGLLVATLVFLGWVTRRTHRARLRSASESPTAE
jgi:hypothetical protein